MAPTIFLTAGQPHEVPISLPSTRADSAATLRIRMEDGERVELKIALGEIPEGDAIRRYVAPAVASTTPNGGQTLVAMDAVDSNGGKILVRHNR